MSHGGNILNDTLSPVREDHSATVQEDTKTGGTELYAQPDDRGEQGELKVPCLVYSRPVGYLTPVENWNEGKQAEFRDRKTYSASRRQEEVEYDTGKVEEPVPKDVRPL